MRRLNFGNGYENVYTAIPGRAAPVTPSTLMSPLAAAVSIALVVDFDAPTAVGNATESWSDAGDEWEAFLGKHEST